MQVNEQIATLVAKKLEGLASAEELEQLQLWLDADTGNAGEYDQLVRIWSESPGALARPAFNTAAAWAKVDAALQTGRSKALVRPLFSFKRVAVAAAIILALGAGWWLYNTPHLQHAEALAANQTLQLPDGSVVELRKGSRIDYPAVFDASERAVRLTGEAFFRVQPRDRQPFRITTAHTRVEVLGTSFLVRSSAAAEEVVVASGSVSVTGWKLTRRMVLEAGQKVELEESGPRQGAVINANYLAWKTGVLDFRNVRLAEALKDISHYYDTPLELAEGQAATSNPSITLHFEHEPFDSVLEELKQVTGLQVKKENGKTLLYQK